MILYSGNVHGRIICPNTDKKGLVRLKQSPAYDTRAEDCFIFSVCYVRLFLYFLFELFEIFE